MGVQGRASSRRLPGQRVQLQQQQQHQGASDGFDISLTTSSSAGDEQQIYESDEIRHQVYHQRDCLHKQQQQQQQYLSSDTEIPSIPSTQTSGERQQQAASSSDPSSFIRQAEQLKHEQMRTKSSSSQQKHRQLQAHIHQQLQRIYGDRSHQHQHQHEQQQDQKLQNCSSQRRKQMKHSQEEHFSSHDSRQSNLQLTTNQLSSSSEQTYDSLSSPNFTPPITKQHQSRFIECRRRISAIPEEEDQQQQQQQQQQHIDVDVDELLLSDEADEDHHHHQHQQHQRRLVESRETQTTRKQTEIVRESQLESLHYATATAAALLSATANAAAAIAATTDQKFMQRQPLIWPQNNKQTQSRVELLQELEQDSTSKYAHPYQEVTSPVKRREHECCRHTTEDRQAAALRKMNCIHQQQQHQQQELMKMMMMKQNQKRLHAEPPPPTTTYHRAPSCHPRPSAHQQHLKHQQLYQHHQQALNHAKQMHHHHQALLNRPIPPQPPARGAKVMMFPGVAMPHQQEHMRYIQQPPRLQPLLPTALAVVHTGAPSKAASAKADLIGRMLINNMVAARRATTEPHYSLKGHGGLNDPYQLVLPPIRDKLYTTQQQQQQLVRSTQAQVYGPAARMPVGRAASDSSGHSSAPLVINRDLAPMTFIERLCRIDLTLFWWSLLLISFLFVGLLVTISRYVL